MGIKVRTPDEFDKRIDTVMKVVEQEPLKLKRLITEMIYEKLIENSPIYTGYYASNHRIAVGATDALTLRPSEKPVDAVRGQFIDNIEKARSTELNKLKKIKSDQSVIIGTAVPYADDLETKYQIYKLSSQEGLELALSLYETRGKGA